MGWGWSFLLITGFPSLFDRAWTLFNEDTANINAYGRLQHLQLRFQPIVSTGRLICEVLLDRDRLGYCTFCSEKHCKSLLKLIT